MENKKISEMTNAEILRKQMELLAECSVNYTDESTIAEISKAMVDVYDRLSSLDPV